VSVSLYGQAFSHKSLSKGKFALNYTDKVFGLSQAFSQISDTRSSSRIPTPSVLWSSFMMQVTRLGSLNALEVDLRWPKRLDALMGSKKPSAETISRVFAKISPTDLRRLHRSHCCRLKRNKVLQTDWPLQAIGLDGHEFFWPGSKPPNLG
jgi:hypothetical protein